MPSSRTQNTPKNLLGSDPLYASVVDIFALVEEAEENAPKRRRSPAPDELAADCILHFFAYLAASDEYIAGKEVRAINDCLGTVLFKDEIQRMIRDENIYTITFEQMRPEVLDFFETVDQKLAKKGTLIGPTYSRRFIDLLEKAGYLFIKIDGSMNEDEERDLKTIIASYRDMVEKIEKGLVKDKE
ncbi:MAG: hypothetical protein IJR83_08415 [Clostridia bacterium]|nr:hypothetical protein [Clostridia bacterium]